MVLVPRPPPQLLSFAIRKVVHIICYFQEEDSGNEASCMVCGWSKGAAISSISYNGSAVVGTDEIMGHVIVN